MIARMFLLGAQLKKFWDVKNQMFARDVPEAGIYIALIPQIYNLKVVVGKLELKDFCHEDGY